MAANVETVQEYIQAVVRSKLLDENELIQLHSVWKRDQNGSDADVDTFRRFLQRRQKLTEYQAKLIQRGRSEGFLIGGYTIMDRIGSGQSAGVYFARHTSGQVVALKVLPSSKARDANALSRFQREGRLLTQLDHPNVVRAYQLEHSGLIHFIVMEHIDGETLDTVIERRKRLPVDESVRIVHQALQGLQHLHDRRMVHRDLKPANLMITPPGVAPSDTTLNATVKILDIGLGREMFDEDTPSTRDLQLTGEGAILGTPDYLAPEQARDARNADIRADIYSLACVLYHLIAGRPPFIDKNVMAQMVKHATETPLLLTDFAPGVPRDLANAVAKMLEKDPNSRPQTPNEAATLLSPFLPRGSGNAKRNNVLPAFRKYLEESSYEISLPPAEDEPGLSLSPPPTAQATTPAPLQPQQRPKTGSATDHKPVAPKPTVPANRPKPAESPQFIDVELVTLPPPVFVPQPLPKMVEDDDEDDDHEPETPRSLIDLNRRDFIMLASGAASILLSIAAGWGLSRLTRKKPDDDEPPTTK